MLAVKISGSNTLYWDSGPGNTFPSNLVIVEKVCIKSLSFLNASVQHFEKASLNSKKLQNDKYITHTVVLFNTCKVGMIQWLWLQRDKAWVGLTAAFSLRNRYKIQYLVVNVSSPFQLLYCCPQCMHKIIYARMFCESYNLTKVGQHANFNT